MILILKKDVPFDYEILLKLNRIASETRSDYNKIIKDLSAGNENNIDWWVSELGSRNTNSNNLFLNLCYLKLIKDLYNEGKNIENIIVDSRPLYRIISKFIQERGLKTKLVLELSFFDKIKEDFKPVKTYFKNLSIFFRRYFFAKIYKKKVGFLPNLTLIDVFVLKNSFNGNVFLDRYFTDFSKFLKVEEINLFYYLPVFFQIENYLDIIKKIRKSERPFLLLEDFLKISDYIFAFLFPFRMLSLKPKSKDFFGFEISFLLKNVWYQNISSYSCFESLLRYRLPKRLLNKNISIRMIVNWNENQNLDKSLCSGFHKYYPDTPIIGHVSSTYYKYYLSLYPTEEEFRNNLLPDIITVSGKALVESKKEFYSDLNVCVSPAFRYIWIWEDRKFFPSDEYYRILVFLPMFQPEITGIMKLLSEIEINSFADKKIKILFKTHPTYTREMILKIAGHYWKNDYDCIDGKVKDLIEQSNLVIGSNTSALLESLALGIPVIVIGNLYGITQNPVPENIDEKIWKICFNKEQFSHALKYFISFSDTKMKVFKEIGAQIKENYFESVSTQKVREFFNIH